MTPTHHIDFVNTSVIQLIKHIDSIIRNGYGFARVISAYIVGILLVVALIPIFSILFLLFTVIARIALYYLSYELRKGIKEVSNLQDERELMEIGLDIKEIKSFFEVIIKSLGSTRRARLYKSLVFGDLLAKCNDKLGEILSIIDSKAYPQISQEPDEEQLERLLKEYDGITLSIED